MALTIGDDVTVGGCPLGRCLGQAPPPAQSYKGSSGVWGKSLISTHSQLIVDEVTKAVDYILSLNPKRIIFNPGTENSSFYTILEAHKIPFEIACTLVLLGTNQY